MKKPELLAPAGSLEKLKTAVRYGADAVYLGGEEFSLRSAGDNFSVEDIKRGIDFARENGKKAYVAINAIMRNDDIDRIGGFINDIYLAGADSVIVSDLGALETVKQAAPGLAVHISTQVNTTNYKSAAFWHKLGAKRVVLARELSGEEVRQIKEKAPEDLELEIFVHGAMCISYSGRCLLSNYMAGRDANRGDCAHPCRWKYSLEEEKRPGQYMPVFENESGSFFFNSKDLCLIEFLPEIINIGIDSLKIEGRIKSEYYVATVVKAYREEIDKYCEKPGGYKLNPDTIEELCKVSHREYFHGFWKGNPREQGQIYHTSSYIRDYDVVGIITECDDAGNARISQRNKFSVGDELEILRPKGGFLKIKADGMKNEEGEQISSAPHPTMTVMMNIGTYAEPYSMLRKRRNI